MSAARNTKADKALQDKLQALLSHLLREEDNKYCADCDAKGPRWASWNLGIFVCIRCAGIHRNLGVHISRVKSVNLDSWTDEQVGSMQNMGNSKGRAVYEANLPDGFRRPQNDSALETFIRGKYEHKKYIAREWLPPTGPQKADLSVLGVPTTGHSRTSMERKLDLSAAASSVPRPNSMSNLKEGLASPTAPAVQKSQQQQQNSAAPTSPSDDLFAEFISAPLPTTTATAPANQASLSPDSDEKDFFNQVSSAPAASANGVCGTGSGGAKIDTASIMSLYAKSPPVQSPLLQHQSGLNMAPYLGPLNGLPPQMVSNNPFLMGGGVMAQQGQLGMPAGYAPQAQLLGDLNQLRAFGGVAATQNAFAVNQAASFGSPMGMSPLGGGVPNQIAGGAMLAPNLVGGTPASNLNLMNSQMSALQLGPSAVNVGHKMQPSNEFKTTAANGHNVLTPNFH